MLDEITVEDVEKFKLRRSKEVSPRTNRVLRPATVNRELACLKALFNYAIKNDVVLKNPVKGVKFLPEDNEQMRVLTYDEERIYLLAASQPLQDVAAMIVETGMRPEEVCRMGRENVHLEQGYYFNPYGKTKAAKRKVPLSERAAAMVRRRLAAAKGEYLFPGGRGASDKDKPLVKVNGAHSFTLARLAKSKETKLKKFRLYDLRHTWATRAAMAGVDLVTLAAMLGHSRVQMVMRYAHPTEAHQFDAMKKMQEYRAAKAKQA
jgi:integrase